MFQTHSIGRYPYTLIKNSTRDNLGIYVSVKTNLTYAILHGMNAVPSSTKKIYEHP